jgi:hypothetical protein
VEVPELYWAANTTLYMYYGYASAADQQNRTGTWSNGYAAVWHLKESPADGAPQMMDSTSNANNGTSQGSMTFGDQVPAKLDGGLDLEGTDDYISALNNGSSLNVGPSFTLEAWIKRNGTGVDGLLTKGYSDQYSFKLALDGSNVLELYVKTVAITCNWGTVSDTTGTMWVGFEWND